MTAARRYLVPFGPKETPHRFADVLIVGAGIAGLRAALEIPPELRALVVTKDALHQSSSSYAQGGIAGVLSPEDRFENHIDDTIAAGAGLCDPAVVELVVREAPKQISDLIDWGTRFDLEEGRIALGREGGHSHRRIVHALGDATGGEIMRAVIDQIRNCPNVSVWEWCFTLDLLTHEGRCAGAVVCRRGQVPELVWAKQTILASGGAGMVFRETTNPPVATGDGMAAAYRAGAELRDMEFMQFHPTLLYVAGSGRHLISEAVRGEGALLRDKNGERFMPAEDPRAELAPRDVVAQAIVRRMEKTQHPNVYLDLRPIGPRARERFPGIDQVCRDFGLDITRDLIPVRPGAHYMIGGVATDAEGRTSLPGLWAAGEVSSSGLHGANRLASNSLLEGLVFGAACGRGAARAAAAMPDRFEAPPLASRPDVEPGSAVNVQDVSNALRSLMTRRMGVVRDSAGLLEARGDVDFWCRYALTRSFLLEPCYWELQNMLTVARLMIGSALAREESRGVHSRSDFPARDDARWRRHLTCPPFGSEDAAF